jgi:ribosomal protein S8E
MIDAIQVPILLKAIDFVFEEGRKILEERRERRKMNDASKTEVEELPKEIIALPVIQGQEVKRDLLASKIDDLSWLNHEEEVQHLVRLLEIHSRNYHLAKEQYAKWGSALVPPIIMHNMTEAENSMLETIERLQAVLSKVYKKDIIPHQ